MRNRYYTLLIFVFLLFLSNLSYAQLRVQHSAPTVIEREANVQLIFRAPGFSSSDIQEAYLFYRFDGETSYQQVEATFRQGEFLGTLNLGNEDASALEYYFLVRTQDGQRITYPGQSPSENPVEVELVEPRETGIPEDTVKREGPATKIDYNILSPEPNSKLLSEDAVIAVTFFYEDTTLQDGEFRLYLDGQDVTGEAEIQSYFLSYVPDYISQGEHQAEVRYVRNGEQYEVTEWQFTVSQRARRVAGAISQREQQSFTSGRVEFAARSQNVALSQEDILRGRVEVNGRQGDVRYNVRGNLTTQESSRLQPRNRFTAEMLIGDWAELRGGDFYQRMSRLTLGGQRVRGVNANVHLMDESINAMFVYGRTRRSISNLYNPVSSNMDTVGVSEGQPIVDTTYTLGYSEQGRGTYQRNILGGRLSFGDETPVQWGINGFKIQDDTSSMQPVSDFGELQSRYTAWDDSLSSSRREHLQNNPGELSIPGHPEPKGNFVASSDLELNLDRNRIHFESEVGVSLLNEDISGGYLTRERANDLGIDLDQGTEDILSNLSWLIIVNENMNTLPFQFEETSGENRELQPYVPMGIFGGHSRARFNYFDHRLQIQYRWMGPNYHSLANNTIRRDLSGFNVSDRFRLFQDQLYVTLGYEQLQNNVLNTQDATTKTSTYRTNLSWYPISRDLPRVSAGIRLRDRGNGVERTNPFLSGEELYAAVRNVRNTQADPVIAPRPVQSFTTQLNASITQQFAVAEVINDATLNVSYLQTEDEVFTYGGLESMSYSLNVQNRYAELPLDTRVGFHVNQSDSRGGLASFDIYGFSLGGTAYLMDNVLRVSGRLAFNHNNQSSTPLEVEPNDEEAVYDNYFVPNTDPGDQVNKETNTFVVNMNARYQLAERHAVYGQANFTNVVTQSTTNLQGTQPNDRIVELRYIFEF